MSFDTSMLATLPMWFVAFLLSTTCHEAAHALVAKLGGDPTASHGGQVSIDPIPHMKREPIGMIVVPLVSFFMLSGNWMIGWASAPYDPVWASRHPRKAAWMAAAGPGANLVLLLLMAGIIHGGIAAGWLAQPSSAEFTRIVVLADFETNAVTMFISILFTLNLLLMLFNLLPVPPLDGQAAIGLFMTEDTARRWNDFSRSGGFAIIGLIIAWVVFGRVFGTVFVLALNALYPGSGYG